MKQLVVALGLIVIASVIPRESAPRSAADITTHAIPLSALPAGYMADEEVELARLRQEGITVGKTVAYRATKKSAWDAVLADSESDTINAAYHTITDLDDGNPDDFEWRTRTYFRGVSIYGNINTEYGDNVWISSTGQSGMYITENTTPLHDLACKISPSLFALPQGGCVFRSSQDARDHIFKGSFWGATEAAVASWIPCAMSGAATAPCMGATWMGYFVAHVAWEIWDVVVVQGCSFGWNGPHPKDPATIYVDGFQR